MRVNLALQHLVFQILLLFFVLQTPLHQLTYIFRQIIDPPADVPQLMIPFYRRISGEIALGDPFHAGLQMRHGNCDHAVHQEHQYNTDGQDADQDAGEDSYK